MQRHYFSGLAVLLAIGSAVLHAQKAEKAESPITVEDVVITVSPGKPTESLSPETLCNLKVKLRNGGTRKTYSFGFGVKINGKEMTVYDKVLYMQTVDPGTTGEIATIFGE